jgi:D-glycero-alpha-D-manno-heptose-7-phosphate kinase
MIITRTPFRISFFGGGTDYPAYYRDCGGAVLAPTINRFCYITLRNLPPFFEYKHRIVYSRTELESTIDNIKHPSVRECLRYMNIRKGLEIHHDGDLPARSGLGSSSSFTVGLLLALNAHKGRMISKRDLAEAAIYVEQEMIRENVGSQDQTMAAFGGLNVVRFSSANDGKHIHQVEPLCLAQSRLDNLQNNLMLFFTGISRTASEVAGEQIAQTPQKKTELSNMQSMVEEAVKILNSEDFDDFGRLLHEAWMIKRSLTSKISNSQIDDLYQTGLKSGATGGKILGAGGGGFLLFYVRPDYQIQLKEKLGLLHVPFRFDFSGSQIIFYDPPPPEWSEPQDASFPQASQPV